MAGRLNRKRPFARIISPGMKPEDPHFEQNGYFYDGRDQLIGEVPGRKNKPAAAKPKKDEKAERAVDRATALLGDLGADPHQEAQRENAAAAAAEELSDDSA